MHQRGGRRKGNNFVVFTLLYPRPVAGTLHERLKNIINTLHRYNITFCVSHKHTYDARHTPFVYFGRQRLPQTLSTCWILEKRGRGRDDGDTILRIKSTVNHSCTAAPTTMHIRRETIHTGYQQPKQRLNINNKFINNIILL